MDFYVSTNCHPLILLLSVVCCTDCEEAHALSPTETSITDLTAKIRETLEDVNTDLKIAAFLGKQSKPATPIPWEEGMVLVKDRIETGYIRVPVQAQGHMMLNVTAPTF